VISALTPLEVVC